MIESFSMTSLSSIRLMIFIFLWHLGQVKGTTSQIFWISRAQFFRYSLDDPSGSSLWISLSS